MTGFQIWLIVVGLLHVFFMLGEMAPWSFPKVLKAISDKQLKPNGAELTPRQQAVVANIVKNAGIYNAVLAGGLFWAAYTEDREVAQVLLAGVAVAGVFGAATLKSWLPAVQGLLGMIAFALI